MVFLVHISFFCSDAAEGGAGGVGGAEMRGYGF